MEQLIRELLRSLQRGKLTQKTIENAMTLVFSLGNIPPDDDHITGLLLRLYETLHRFRRRAPQKYRYIAFLNLTLSKLLRKFLLKETTKRLLLKVMEARYTLRKQDIALNIENAARTLGNLLEGAGVFAELKHKGMLGKKETIINLVGVLKHFPLFREGRSVNDWFFDMLLELKETIVSVFINNQITSGFSTLVSYEYLIPIARAVTDTVSPVVEGEFANISNRYISEHCDLVRTQVGQLYQEVVDKFGYRSDYTPSEVFDATKYLAKQVEDLLYSRIRAALSDIQRSLSTLFGETSVEETPIKEKKEEIAAELGKGTPIQALEARYDNIIQTGGIVQKNVLHVIEKIASQPTEMGLAARKILIVWRAAGVCEVLVKKIREIIESVVTALVPISIVASAWEALIPVTEQWQTKIKQQLASTETGISKEEIIETIRNLLKESLKTGKPFEPTDLENIFYGKEEVEFKGIYPFALKESMKAISKVLRDVLWLYSRKVSESILQAYSPSLDFRRHEDYFWLLEQDRYWDIEEISEYEEEEYFEEMERE